MNGHTTPIRIFIAYSKEDRDFLDKFLVHLNPHERRNLVTIFSDKDINAGAEFDKTIKYELQQADIIILMVSANFVATKYCYEIETTNAIERYEKEGIQVIPIIVSYFDFEELPFSKFNFLPEKARPITSYSDINEAYTMIVKKLRQENYEKARQHRQQKEEKAAKRQQYDDCCKKADDLFKEEKWKQAKSQYEAARGMYEEGYTPNVNALQTKIYRCVSEITAREYVDDANAFLQDRKYTDAAKCLQEALKEKPSLENRSDIQTLQQQIQDGIATEQKAREEAERKAREEAEQKAREEAEQKAREEAERKVREEAERKAREEAKIHQLPTPIQQLLANMVLVQGGTFMMGCTKEQEGECKDNEKPAHQVSVDDFYIGKYEVTQAQWRAVMGSDPPELWNKNCDQCPVESVSHDDIQEFLQKLNQLTGKTYRLPTEAEWEYAARGGNKSKGYKYAGSNDIGSVAWYYDNYKRSKHGDKETTHHPVGTKAANELGLYDMTGNVWEWCSDWYDADYYKNSPANNPKGPGIGTGRVLRGGCWYGNAQFCRVSNRAYNSPAARINYIGFRLALPSRT